MPKYLIRNTSDESLSTVEGVLPLDLKALLDPGEYGVSALSDEVVIEILPSVSLPPGSPVLFADLTDDTAMTLSGDLVASITPQIGGFDLTATSGTQPAYVGSILPDGGVRFTADHISIPTDYAFDRRAMSVFVITRKGAVGRTGFQALFHSPEATTATALYIENGGIRLAAWDGSGRIADIAASEGVSVQYLVGGAANAWVGSDFLRWAKGSALAAGSSNGGRLGKWSGTSFPYQNDMLAFVAYDRELSTVEMDAVVAWAQSRYNTPSADELFVFSGDSITNGTQLDNPQINPHANDFSYPSRFQLLRSAPPRIAIQAVPGGLLQANAAPSAALINTALLRNSGVTTRVVFGLWGHNDIVSGRTGAELSADFDAWIAAIRLEHPSVLIGHGTILPSTAFTAPMDVEREVFNNYVRDTVTGPDLDFVVDTAVISGITKVDGVHPDSAGYIVLAQGIVDGMVGIA